jgi:hypothetical protein
MTAEAMSAARKGVAATSPTTHATSREICQLAAKKKRP